MLPVNYPWCVQARPVTSTDRIIFSRVVIIRPLKSLLTDPSRFGTIYLCGGFWTSSTIGTDSRAGTLVHESSHWTANGGTYDYAYGQANCKQLAITNQYEALFNGDNYAYFAENTPYLS